jgi:hypothetical protein
MTALCGPTGKGNRRKALEKLGKNALAASEILRISATQQAPGENDWQHYDVWLRRQN